MTIASHVFLLLFLPITVLVYYGALRQSRHKMFFLLAASYIFYALADLKFLPLLFLLSWSTYYFAKRRWTGLGIVLNLAALLVFKYWNFGVDTFNFLMDSLNLDVAANLLQLGLPLGISFFVFKHIGYLLDVQRGLYPATDDFWAFATFSVYFPQISAGPISSFRETADQFQYLPNQLKREQVYSGLVYLSMGLAKKVLIADALGSLLATSVNSQDGFTGLIPAWYIVIAYAMQLYFDFSGYTDMVLGVSTFFGITLPPNFNNPYLAANPTEFWERWHMSLSNWFKYYLFSPISRFLLRKGGSAWREQSQYIANLSTMALVGLWHGAGWMYILWGAYHGFLINLHVWWKRKNIGIPAWLGRTIFLLGIALSWVFFMSPDLGYLRHLLMQMTGFGGLGDSALLSQLLWDSATPALFAALVLSITGLSEAASVLRLSEKRNIWPAILWGVLTTLGLLFLGGEIQFLYVQF